MTNFNIARFFTRKNLFEAGIKNSINWQLQQYCSNLKNSYFEASKVIHIPVRKTKIFQLSLQTKTCFKSAINAIREAINLVLGTEQRLQCNTRFWCICCQSLIGCWRYTNADLKISLYVCVHLKTRTWKFRILNPKNFWVICPWSL